MAPVKTKTILVERCGANVRFYAMGRSILVVLKKFQDVYYRYMYICIENYIYIGLCKLAFCLSTHLQTSFEARRNGRLDTRLQVYFMHLLPHSFLKYVAKGILDSVFYLNFSEDHKTETRPYYHTVSPKPMNICVVFDNKRNDLKEVKSVSIKIAVYSIFERSDHC